MKQILIIFTLLITFSSFAQKNRKPFSLEIAANETQQYKAEIPESPYFVKEKLLQIYCGEKVFVECEIAGDSISSMKIVAENIHPEKTIEIQFSQDAKDRKNINTMLQLNNPFNKDLVYEAIMLTPSSGQWKSTSTIPITAKLKSFETWGHSIISLGLMNWHFK
ncbi:hypothetical protein [Flavobacterium sp. LC2016-01]|uniref:hypothetical protein n=1 Tax=Flavobacterium sp. LC2016-01 TaxID=2675876 RepID=UPI0012BB09D2|nr:hypothetical protein [Flavobacterium sp. LC2016-01]MTH14269.1 hypothetical protein [Flavobacterium sp. LC2016-01]